MLSNLTISFTIHSYGTITDNAGGISDMALKASNVKEITDELDAAGNATSSLGKAFANGAACLVSISLMGAFVKRSHVTIYNIDYNRKHTRSCNSNYGISRSWYTLFLFISNNEGCY